MKKTYQALILAGGRGTRLAPYTDENPKPMYPINGKPFLEHLINQLEGFGITEIILLLGYKAEKITSYFGDGKNLGVNIKYSITDIENETGKRINAAKSIITGDFLLMYCDNYCPIDFSKASEMFYAGNAQIQVTAYDNTDGYTKNNLRVSNDGSVETYDKSRTAGGLNAVDIGYAFVRREVLDRLTGENVSFEKAVYPWLVADKSLTAFVTSHRYYSIGSCERLNLTKTFFTKQEVVFLDRDGTLNVRPGKAQYITRPEDFVWLPGAREAVKRLNENGYKVFLITNQPCIAMGLLTMDGLDAIHKKMTDELSEIGAHIDKIYYCPHGWHDGCICRKPNPGMLWQAQREFNFNMQDAVFYGDDERDMLAAEAAGCKGVLVDDNNTLGVHINDKTNRLRLHTPKIRQK